MARDYAKVSPQFWIGDTGRKLRAHPEARLLAAYLISSPNSTMTGLYYLPMATIAHELGMTTDVMGAAFHVLGELGFAFYDVNTDLVWVVEMAFWQIEEHLAATDNRVKGVKKELAPFGDHPLAMAFWEKYQEPFSLGPRPVKPAPRSPRSPLEAPPKPLRSQEQDQDQEQRERARACAHDPSSSSTEHAPGAPEPAPPAPAKPAQPEPAAGTPEAVFVGAVRRGSLTGFALGRVFGAVREQEIANTLAWQVPQGSSKADEIAAACEDPDVAADVVPTMRLLFQRARAGKLGRESATFVQDASFAFAGWCTRFTTLREAIRGRTPPAPPPPADEAARCPWHAKGGKGASRYPRDACPDCREQKARAGGRDGEPASVADVLAGFKPLEQPKEPASAEQLAELRLERQRARAGGS